MKQVTYQSRQVNPKTDKPYIIEELTEASHAVIKLRAMALNWDLISIQEDN